jgi:hypothetical protein
MNQDGRGTTHDGTLPFSSFERSWRKTPGIEAQLPCSYNLDIEPFFSRAR